MSSSIDHLYKLYTQSSGVSTDTRFIKTGNIFFALKGPNFNGNTYAQNALASGADYCVIDEAEFSIEGKTILVENVLETLQLLARKHRDTLGIPFIGVTGSNGKTTSKELITAVLSKKFKTYATQGNLNNHIGVPLTILSISPDTEMAVVELGANHIGEIEVLCQIANPSHGFVTNVGMDHLEGYGSFEGVAKGSSEIYYHLLKNGGQVFVNSKDELLMRMSQRFEKRILYPQHGDDYHAEIANQDFYISIKTETGTLFETKLIGAYNFDNAALALCIGKYFGVHETDANAAIADYIPSNNRSQVMPKGTNTIIMDAYNANPSSMGLSVSNFGLMAAPNKVAILGDMYELGEYSIDEHAKMITLAESCKLTKVIFCGKEFYKHKNNTSLFFASRDELTAYLKANPFHNTNILLKGSRGMALEKLVEAI